MQIPASLGTHEEHSFMDLQNHHIQSKSGGFEVSNVEVLKSSCPQAHDVLDWCLAAFKPFNIANLQTSEWCNLKAECTFSKLTSLNILKAEAFQD